MKLLRHKRDKSPQGQGSEESRAAQPRPLQSSDAPHVPLWALLLPFVVLTALLVCVIRYFGSDALDGASQLALLFSSGFTAAIAMIFLKVPWERLEEAVRKNIGSVFSAVLILFFIGAISGSWMISGVVPTLIYYGLQVLSPGAFLFLACLICALVSLMTGSSWTTVATIGIAFEGVGVALGYSPAWIAGAIISGAYFGDKMSPLSDTTVLASSVGGVSLFTHIRYMMITTVPSITIALVVFLVVSLTHSAEGTVQTASFATGLQQGFVISPWLLLVPVVTAVLIALRLPAVITLFLSSLVAGVVTLIVQPQVLASIGGGGDFAGIFRGLMITFFGETSIDTGNEVLNNLVHTHGIHGVLNTVFLIICAATFGGMLTGSGILQNLTERLSRHIASRGSLVGSTVAAGLFSNMITGDQYLSIVLTTSLYKRLYAEKGYEGRLLSRTAEDSATVTSVLIPWNTCGMTQSMVLKVPTVEYLPYCFFNLISPFMTLCVALVGYKIHKVAPSHGEDDEPDEKKNEKSE